MQAGSGFFGPGTAFRIETFDAKKKRFFEEQPIDCRIIQIEYEFWIIKSLKGLPFFRQLLFENSQI